MLYRAPISTPPPAYPEPVLPGPRILSTMSFQLRSSARIPSRSCSSFTLLAFLLLFTLPQHRAQGEGAAPAWSRVPDTPQRAIAVSWSQERGKGSPSTVL